MMIGLLSCALSVFRTRIATRSSFFRRREKAVVMVNSSLPPFMGLAVKKGRCQFLYSPMLRPVTWVTGSNEIICV